MALSGFSNKVFQYSSTIANILLRQMNKLENNLTLVCVVAVALFDQLGRVLLQQRCLDGVHGGLWEFPGGKIIDGESPEMALVREIFEELGIAIDPAGLVPVAFASDPAQPPMPREPYVILLYTCRKWQGDPQALEHAALKWVRPQAMRDYPMPPADEPLVAALCDLL